MRDLDTWTRRGLLLAGVVAAGCGPAHAVPASPRVAAIDWGWAATLMALGVPPVGVAECRAYADWVGEPALPPGTRELGLRTAPSLETLVALRPDLILINSLNAALRFQLERIAPTLESPIFTANRTPLANARDAARQLGARLGRAEAARAWIADSERRIAAARARLGSAQGRPLLPVQIGDRRSLTYYGRGSLYNDVLETLGLRNAFSGSTSQWGHRTDDLASLGSQPPGDLLVVAPLSPASAALLDGPSLLASLVAVGDRRVYRVPQVWTFGELTAATRFAELVTDALAGPSGRA